MPSRRTLLRLQRVEALEQLRDERRAQFRALAAEHARLSVRARALTAIVAEQGESAAWAAAQAAPDADLLEAAMHELTTQDLLDELRRADSRSSSTTAATATTPTSAAAAAGEAAAAGGGGGGNGGALFRHGSCVSSSSMLAAPPSPSLASAASAAAAAVAAAAAAAPRTTREMAALRAAPQLLEFAREAPVEAVGAHLRDLVMRLAYLMGRWGGGDGGSGGSGSSRGRRRRYGSSGRGGAAAAKGDNGDDACGGSAGSSAWTARSDGGGAAMTTTTTTSSNDSGGSSGGGGGGGDAGAAARAALASGVGEVVVQFGAVMRALHLAADQTCLALCSLNLDTLAPVAADDLPDEAFWARVAARSRPTRDQRRVLAAGFEAYASQRRPLLQRQAQVVGELHALLTGADGGGSSTGTGTDTGGGGGGNGIASLEAAERAERLLLELRRLVGLLRENSRRLTPLWANTLDDAQVARAALASFPFLVQPVPVCEAVWRREQEKEEVRERQQGPQQPAGQAQPQHQQQQHV